jgi:hypothetical protein
MDIEPENEDWENLIHYSAGCLLIIFTVATMCYLYKIGAFARPVQI